MADENAKPEKAKSEKAKDAPNAAKAPKAAKASAEPAAKPAKAAKAAPTSSRGTCTAKGCKQPLRAKGLCRKHYMGWRRGTFGTDHRYKTCSKEACLKKVLKAGLCEEHQPNAKPAGGDAAAPAAG
jgi:hypothetical protein